MAISAAKRKSPVDFLTPQDRKLLERTFDLCDPAQLEGLLDRPPDTDEIPEIEYAYDVTPPGGRAKGHAPHLTCVFPHSARHWKGSIVRWKNGERSRLGPTCGADHFGFDFKAVEERFRSARSRKNDLVRFVALRELLPAVVAELRQVYSDRSISAYDQLRQQLREDFPELHHALGVIARLDSMLRTTSTERNHDAEHNRAERGEEGRKLLKACEDAVGKGAGVVKACSSRLKQWLSAQPPILKTVTQDVGPLAAGAFLTDPRPLAHAVATATMTLSKLSDEVVGNRSDHWSGTNDFSYTFKAIRDVIDQVDTIASRINEARQFSSEANLSRIAQWTEFECRSSGPRVEQAVSARGRTLICLETYARWSFPAATKLPALTRLEELRRLIGG